MVDLNTFATAQAVYGIDPATLAPLPAPGTSANPTQTQSKGSTTLATNQVTVATTATLVIAARAAGRNAVTITNITGAQPSYYGPTNAVTAANGHFLPGTVGASITLPYSGAVYGIAVTAAQTVSFAETYG